MATLDFAHREITAHLVYFGAPGAGARTNLAQAREGLPAGERSPLLTFGPGGALRVFELVDLKRATVPGFSCRYRVLALPGAGDAIEHRAAVLADADGIVFVADARPERAQANVDGLLELEQGLADLGRDMSALAMVLQVNHTDHASARPTDKVAYDLNPYGFPVLASNARDGAGVSETLEAALRIIEERLRAKLSGAESALQVHAVHQPRRDRIEDVIARYRRAVADDAAPEDDSALYQSLPPGPEVELAFQPRDLVGTRPVRVLHGQVDHDGIRLEIVVERIGGGEPRRLTIRLANRPTDALAVPRHTRAQRVLGHSPTSTLPDSITLPPPRRDFHPVWYGIAGVAGGGFAGLLIGFLLFG